jgi:hypothetical protein
MVMFGPRSDWCFLCLIWMGIAILLDIPRQWLIVPPALFTLVAGLVDGLFVLSQKPEQRKLGQHEAP